MEQLLFDIIFWGAFVGGGSAFVIFAFIMAIKQGITIQKNPKKSEDYTPVEQSYSPLTIKATVIDQYCDVETIGIKIPKTVKVFFIVFQTEYDEILKLNVSEEMYGGFQQGQTGILSIIDGKLYGFELVEKSD
ncbi:MAG: hypothetical protein IKU82_04850 [Clostridia bacterium]|nr:hypothetical protein [Clostridia bacterium]